MKKLIEKIKSILGLNKKSPDAPQGFTLIELLVVIAVIGILAAALLLAIDPIDKINAGNDTKVINDTRSIHDAALRYYTNNNALPTTTGATAWDADGVLYPTEIKSIPDNPANYSAYVYAVNPAGDDASLCGQVKSKANMKKATASAVGSGSYGLVYVSNGKQCFTLDDNGACPTDYYQCPN
jgi:prepilin-type N-terminal cleavage/methylation domain-containing protein